MTVSQLRLVRPLTVNEAAAILCWLADSPTSLQRAPDFCTCMLAGSLLRQGFADYEGPLPFWGGLRTNLHVAQLCRLGFLAGDSCPASVTSS